MPVLSAGLIPVAPSDHAITPMLQWIGSRPGIGSVGIGYLIVVVAIDANDVIVAPRIEVLPSVGSLAVPIPDLGLAEFFTSGGEMKTIWRVLG